MNNNQRILKAENKSDDKENIDISIVIPVYNEKKVFHTFMKV